MSPFVAIRRGGENEEWPCLNSFICLKMYSQSNKSCRRSTISEKMTPVLQLKGDLRKKNSKKFPTHIEHAVTAVGLTKIHKYNGYKLSIYRPRQLIKRGRRRVVSGDGCPSDRRRVRIREGGGHAVKWIKSLRRGTSRRDWNFRHRLLVRLW